MDKQELFDKVVRHLHEQGGPALDDNGGCVYRTSEGRKCAVGCLIPDERYRPNLEGSLVNYGKVRSAIELPITEEELTMLIDLQHAHDGAFFIEGNWDKVWHNVKGIAYRLWNAANQNKVDPQLVIDLFGEPPATYGN